MKVTKTHEVTMCDVCKDRNATYQCFICKQDLCIQHYSIFDLKASTANDNFDHCSSPGWKSPDNFVCPTCATRIRYFVNLLPNHVKELAGLNERDVIEQLSKILFRSR